MKPTSRFLSVVLLGLLLPGATFGQSSPPYVSSFTISGSVIGGSTQYATATITIGNFFGGYTEAVFFSTNVAYECDHPLVYGFGCYADSPSIEVKFHRGCVSEETVVSVRAALDYENDPGKTADLIVLPLHSSLSVPDVMMSGQKNGSATITLDAPPRDSLHFDFSALNTALAIHLTE